MSHSTVTPFPPQSAADHPLRQYAREVLGALALDARQAVLAWRIANHLVGQVRPLTGRPPAPLDDVPEAERTFYLNLASTALAIVASIDEAPPTPGEIRQVEARRALALARAKARCLAAQQRHQLEPFRPSEPGYELALCRACSAGVSLHLGTAGISVSDGLQRPCERRA